MKPIKQDPEEDINISHTYNNDNQNNNNQDFLNRHPTKKKKKQEMVPGTKNKYIDVQFDNRVKELKRRKEQYGHCDVHSKDDFSLYMWCVKVRAAYKKLKRGEGQTSMRLTSQRIQVLEDLGFNFNTKQERKTISSMSLPNSKVKMLTPDTINQSSNFSCSDGSFKDDGEEDEEDGDDDDDDEDDDNDDDDGVEEELEEQKIILQSFDDRIKALKEFKEKYGHLDVPWKCDRSLYAWCSNMRSGYKRMQDGEPSNCGLSNERIKILKDLGFDFRTYIDRNNSSEQLSTQISAHDRAQKQGIDRRKSIESSCSDPTEKLSSFDIHFNQLQKFKDQYGHCRVSKDYSLPLFNWCTNMRTAYKLMSKGKRNYRLNPERVKLLKDIGFEFSSNSMTSSPGKKRKFSKSSSPNQTSSNTHIKMEQGSNSIPRPASPAFDLTRYTYEELLQQAKENEAMCTRMEMKAKIRPKKSLKDIESSIFNSEDEEDSKGKFECRFCGLKFNFQCVCILHMPKCKVRMFDNPALIKKLDS